MSDIGFMGQFYFVRLCYFLYNLHFQRLLVDFFLFVEKVKFCKTKRVHDVVENFFLLELNGVLTFVLNVG